MLRSMCQYVHSNVACSKVQRIMTEKRLTENNLHLKLENFLFPQSQRKFLRKNKHTVN